ncbi:glycosyltransferase family 4 protein [Cryobacterium sp. SO1]|uniref:glycosyltransferase family 4 protein n=1 Tax=Cryobacterium sp. SO1 TaxID=1897061 RepID=UPI0010E7059D|nr:glycosyltransferase family 4 protein [Cryobacterium sp. SO1]RZI37136.1 Alpha-D-kanosaminyltransferase [Cryobacterium sp. SO1]
MTRVDIPQPTVDAAESHALRVLVIGLNYTPETTGISPYTSALARGLAQRGIAVSALTAHPHYPEWKIHDGYGGWTSTEVIDAVPVTRLKHYVPASPGGVNRLVSELSFGLRLLFARWGRPDVVVMVSPALFSTAIGMLRARLSPNRPLVNVWVQDIYSLGITETGMGNGPVAKFITWVEKTTLKAAAGVVVIHDRFGEHLSRRLGVDPGNIEIVRNWTHLDPGAPTDVAATRARHGWADDETIVLHAGNMGVKQGLENVVHAARLADEQNSPVRFVLLGNGSQRDELQELGATIVRLQFIGSLDDAGFQDALSAADVLLVNEKPGVSEMAVPSKLTSYFNAARPVIGATDPDGLTASEIEAAEGGRIVAAGDPQALLEAALALGSDLDLARHLGANGFRYRTQVLGEAAAIDRFASWLRTLTARSGTRR